MNPKKEPTRSLPEKHRDDVPGNIAKAGKKLSARGNASPFARLASLHPQKKTNPTQVEYFKDIVATIREPLVVLDAGLRVLSANRSFYKFFKVKPGETVGSLIYDLGNRQWDIPALRTLLETILPQKAVFNDYEVEHDFPSIGRRILLLNARRIPGPPKEPQWILLAFEDVTMHMRLEHTLQASEERFRGAFETAHESMLLIDKTSGQIVNSNQAAQDLLGWSGRALLKKNLWELGILKDRRQLKQTSVKLEKQGVFWFYNTTILTRQGGHFPADVYLMDKADVIQCNIRDITERKQTDKALVESEERFRSLYENATVGIYRTTPDGQILMANPALVRMLGYGSFEDLSQRDLTKKGYEPEYPREEFRKRIEQEGKVQGLESAWKRKDGATIFVRESAHLVQDENGQPLYYEGTVEDITERKKTEEELIIANKELAFQNEEKEKRAAELSIVVENLKRNEELLRETGALAKVGGAEVNLSDMTLNWTEEMFRTHELEPGRIPSIEEEIDYYAPEARPIIQEAVNHAIATGEGWSLELPFITAKGKHLWIRSMGKPEMKDGKTSRILGVFQDITERKQSEEEIRSRTEELTTLYQLSRLLADAGDLESAIELITRHAVESVHITFACLALLEDSELVTRAVYPVRVLDHELIVGDRQPLTALPVCQRVLDKNEPVILQAGSPEIGSLERLTLQLDFARSVCLVPLLVGGAAQGLSNALGLLILGEARQEKRESFTSGKIHLARSIGDQAGSAIRRFLLRQQAGRRLQQLASLSEIDRTIASSFDLRLSLQMILKHVSEQLEVDAADVLVLNDRLQILEFTAGRGYRTPAMESMRQRLSEGQAGLALRERHIVQIPDVAASGAAFAQPELIKAEHVAAYFAVPLITKGKVNGVLEIYHRTPLNPNAEWLDFLKTLAGQAAIAIDNVHLFDGLQRSNTELALAYDATIEGWSHALELRDKETEGHTLRVADMTVKLARSLGLGEAELAQVRWGVLLHDIGKMGVPDGILLKPGPLTAEEWVVMKKHPTFAYEMLSPIRYLRLALDIPYCHHEKWDGSGYPRGLKGEQIPLVARIFAVVDVWDALISDRPYRLAWPEEKARQLIKTGAGTHFDPQVVKEFLLESG